MEEDLGVRAREIEKYIAFGRKLESEIDVDTAKEVIRNAVVALGLLRKTYLEQTRVSSEEYSLGERIKKAHDKEFGQARIADQFQTEFYLNDEVINAVL